MRNLKLIVVLFAASVLLCTDAASAAPIPALNLPELTKKADLIVAGQVIAVQEEGRVSINTQGRPVPARRMNATLRTFRVLKGPSGTAIISFVFLDPEVPLGYAGVAAPQFGLFFLRAAPQQGYEVLNPYHPFVVASPDAPTTSEGGALERVIAEVAHVLNSPLTPLEERKRAVGILAGVESPAAEAVLKKASQALDGPVRLHIAAALLRRNDIKTLDLAEKVLTSPPQEVESGVLSKLAYAIRDGVTDSRAVPALTRLLESKEVIVRQSAAAALRHVGDETVIEPLLKALQDGDREVRYQAVLGLAIVTGKSDWSPSLDLFIKEEQRYLTYWREWAKPK
ncbi:MAG: HEAT repeat domain-containing protein [Acidobacteria bacterium]|nr:HEAT repeat domain-containing protein [Acidobacteriota bacterium]